MKKIIPCHFRCSFALAFDLYRDDGHARANDNCSPRFLLLCFAGKKGTLSAPKTDTRLWETVVHPQWRRDTFVTAVMRNRHCHYIPVNGFSWREMVTTMIITATFMKAESPVSTGRQFLEVMSYVTRHTFA